MFSMLLQHVKSKDRLCNVFGDWFDCVPVFYFKVYWLLSAGCSLEDHIHTKNFIYSQMWMCLSKAAPSCFTQTHPKLTNLVNFGCTGLHKKIHSVLKPDILQLESWHDFTHPYLLLSPYLYFICQDCVINLISGYRPFHVHP